MSKPVHHCSVCGAEQSPDTPLIAGIDGHICEPCVSLAQAGCVGEDVESVLGRLLDAAEGQREIAEWGIVYIQWRASRNAASIRTRYLESRKSISSSGLKVKTNRSGRLDDSRREVGPSGFGISTGGTFTGTCAGTSDLIKVPKARPRSRLCWLHNHR